MGKVFIIVAPEQTCSRYLKRMFIDAGCWGTRDNNIQTLDYWYRARGKQDIREVVGEADKVVFHRSTPHSSSMPCLHDIGLQFRNQGFTPYLIIAIREFKACCRSKIGRKALVTNEKDAASSLRSEMAFIFSQLHGMDYYYVDMSLLQVAPERVLDGLEEFTGLKFDFAKEPIKDVDKKHHNL